MNEISILLFLKLIKLTLFSNSYFSSISFLETQTDIKSEKELILGKVISIEHNNEEVKEVKLHDEVCIKLDNPNELSYDRHFSLY